MPGKNKWLVTVLIVTLSTVGLAIAAGADSGSEQGFLAAINSERSAQGLGPLKMDGGLQKHARNHTQDMIEAGDIFHSTSSELKAAGGSGWSKLGENVGRGGTVSSLHGAFMASSGHRKNILGDYNFVGIGTDTSDGVLYVSVVFMKKGETSPAPTTAPTTTTTAAPKSSDTTQAKTKTSQPPSTTTPAPTTTTTTLPPTTTTTLIVGPDKPVTPGLSCYMATRDGWICQD